jgi:hypothetical protein
LEENFMRKIIASALLATTLGLGLTAIAAPAPASAQGIVITPNGIRIYPGDRDYDRYDRRWRRELDRRDAVQIAQRHGVSRVRSVDRRRGAWVVTGEARRGPGLLRVTIDGRSGRVIGIDRVRGR